MTGVSWIVTAFFFFPYTLPGRWFFLNTWAGWLAGAALAEVNEVRPTWLSGTAWWLAGVVAWIGGIWLHASGLLSGRWLLLDVPMLIALSLWPLSAGLFWPSRSCRRPLEGSDNFSTLWLASVCQATLCTFCMFLSFSFEISC